IDSLAALSMAHGARLFVDDVRQKHTAAAAAAPLRSASVTPAQLAANPSLVAGKVVIAAPPAAATRGDGSHEALAAALAGAGRAAPRAAAMPARATLWLAVLAVLAAVVLTRNAVRNAPAVLLGAGAGVPVVGAMALFATGSVLPMTGPAALLGATAGVLALRRHRGEINTLTQSTEPSLLADARRLAAAGRIGQAW